MYILLGSIFTHLANWGGGVCAKVLEKPTLNIDDICVSRKRYTFRSHILPHIFMKYNGGMKAHHISLTIYSPVKIEQEGRKCS